MEDLKLIEAIERYHNGEMTQAEREAFETLRSTHQEVDQLTVEQLFFLRRTEKVRPAETIQIPFKRYHPPSSILWTDFWKPKWIWTNYPYMDEI